MRHTILLLLSPLLLAALAACQPRIDEREAFQTPPADLKIIGGRNCPHCGRIESRKEIPGDADPRAPRVYEYILRMPDGSHSIFQETLPATWRVGERVRVLEGLGG